jgi:polysaccharide chain length determinant protein (PEP-CTERM system associated)
MPDSEEGQAFNFSEIPQLLRRRRWWIVLTAFVTTLATIPVVQLLPNRYTSEATVLVIQQQVPERYVVSTTTTDVSEALQGMTQEVLSRSSLLAIIDAVGLYANERGHVAAEQLITRMRRRLDIQPLESSAARRNVNSFRISFVADDAHLAQEVTSRVTSCFIQENVKMREHQATATTGFLGEQLAAVKKQLETQETLVQSFKMQHLGDLPEQQQGNVQILSSLSGQLQNTVAALSRAQEQKVYLESLLRGYQSVTVHDAGTAVGPTIDATGSVTDGLERELVRLRAEKTTLLSKYTASHPDVAEKDAEIAKTEALLAQAQLLPPAPEPQKTGTPSVGARRREDAPTAQVKSQLEANRVEMENLTNDANQLKEKIARYQERLNSTPVREQQLAGMLRDYELLKLNYADLLKKQLESGLAVSLEKHQEGQQFRVIDPASLPALPSFPNRPMLRLGGAAAGLLLGLALGFVVDITNRPFYTEKELSQRFPVPLVLSVPLLLSPAQLRKRSGRRAFEALAGCIVIVVVCIAELYVYRHD